MKSMMLFRFITRYQKKKVNATKEEFEDSDDEFDAILKDQMPEEDDDYDEKTLDFAQNIATNRAKSASGETLDGRA